MAVPIGGLVAAGVFGGYVITSLLLLRFPLLIHKKKKLKFRCQHISHRGGAGENLENTMTAFQHAVECGTDMLELDVQLTADKEVVVSHDDHLLRVTGVDAHISETELKNLPSLNSSIGVTFVPGTQITSASTDRRIPLLKEVFEAFPDVNINLDVKEDNDELMDKVYDLICEYNRKEKTAWGNFRQSINKKLYIKDPEIPLFFSLRKVVTTVILFYLGLLSFIPLKESVFDVAYARPLLRVIERRWRWLLRFASWLLLSPVLFRHLERRGIQTYLWVLNEDCDFEHAFERLGVAGVMTDYPSKLQSYLKRQAGDPSTHLIED